MLLKASDTMVARNHLKNLRYDAFCLPFFFYVPEDVENSGDDTDVYLSFNLVTRINVSFLDTGTAYHHVILKTPISFITNPETFALI